LFKGNRLCIMNFSMRENLLKGEAQWWISMAFWPRQDICKAKRSILLARDAVRSQEVLLTDVEFASIRREKRRMRDSINHYPYQTSRGMGISMDFVLRLSRTQRGVDSISLWYLTGFLRWHISFHARKLVM
jgi:hypothetical protein